MRPSAAPGSFTRRATPRRTRVERSMPTPEPAPAIAGSRDGQMFPFLEAAEIERARRFGDVRSFAAGDSLELTGDSGHGIAIVLAGEVDVSRRHESGRLDLIVTHRPGAFL